MNQRKSSPRFITDFCERRSEWVEGGREATGTVRMNEIRSRWLLLLFNGLIVAAAAVSIDRQTLFPSPFSVHFRFVPSLLLLTRGALLRRSPDIEK